MAGEWETGTLGDIAELVMGQSPTGETCNENGKGFPLLNGPTEFGVSHPRPVQFTTDPRKFAEPGDLLFCVRGSTTGRMNWADQRYAIGRGLAAIRPKQGSEYRHFVRAVIDANLPRLLASATGSTFPNVSREQIREIECDIPPLAEQKAIAAVLGALDDQIELNRRMNTTLEAMARALFQSWFVDFDPVRAKLDGRSPVGLNQATAALFPNSFENSSIGPIPKGWTIGTIEGVTSLIIDHRGKTPKKMGSDWSSTGVPAVSAKNVKGGRLVRPDTFNFVSEELYERWMKDKLALGDILMTSEAPLGELYYLALDTRYCLSQRIFALRANPAVCEPAYLYYWLESPACQTDIINRGTGTTVEGIRQSELRQVSVLLPSLPIQSAAAKLLGAWTEQIHRNEAQSRTLAALRDGLLPKLLSGELNLSGIPPSSA